jgi:DNA (cytosine-5)-methyltransferase 1
LKPRLLDAFCGEGGAGRGYADAGFDVFGVDNDPKRLELYPFESHCGDAVQFIAEHGHEFDVIHGSPTCTGYSQGTVALPDRLSRYDRLIAATREAMQMTGAVYVLENVYGARRELDHPIMLCGRQFGLTATDTDGTALTLDRHRLFESSEFLLAPPHPKHDRRQVAGAYGGARRDKDSARNDRHGGYVPASLDVLRELLGTPWMSEKGCFLSIPPIYARFVGEQLLSALEKAA